MCSTNGFVGDRDSLIHPTLLESVPVWGHAIKKLECANHPCKCYHAGLEKLTQENPSYKEKGGLTPKMHQQFTIAARCAIKMCSEETDKHQALPSLEGDLINGPLHCFGHHTRCSPNLCSTAREKQQQSIPTEDSGESDMTIQEADSADGTTIIGRKTGLLLGKVTINNKQN